MPTCPRAFAAWRRAAFATLLSLLCATAQATPDDLPDPVSHFLAENGFVEATSVVDAPVANAPAPVEAAAGNRFVRKLRDGASDMVLTAMNFLGVPYRRGGDSADRGFDCSGFTRHVFETSLGLVLPRRADDQASALGLVDIGRDELKPGDLVFFNTLRRTFSHVGIYVGDGRFIHSPRAGGEVRVENMTGAYWLKRYTGARRAEPSAAVRPSVLPIAQATLPALR